jgi:DNA-binding PadR family transcriptional regulator
MITDKEYLAELQDAWELNFKKGFLSFWILLALREEDQFLEGIMEFIRQRTKNKLSYDEQSTYRALRKFTELELITFEMYKSNKGPDLKKYRISKLGNKLLQNFINDNFAPFYQSEFIHLLKL